MTIKRGFWWGKLSGLLAGSMMGVSGLALSIFVDALWHGRLLTDADWLWQMILYGIVGLFAGAFGGAILGTLLGVLIAWAQLDELVPAIWLFAGAIAGLFVSLVPHDLYSLLSPIVWLMVGGVIGWYCGHFFLNGALAKPKKTAVSTHIDSA